MRSSKAFTLIELLLIIAIIGLLALLPMLGQIGQYFKGYDAVRKKDLHNLQTAFENYFQDKNGYPKNAQTVLNNCGGNDLQPYLDSIPCDPVTKSGYQVWTDSAPGVSGKKYVIFANLQGPNNPPLAQCHPSYSGPDGCPSGSTFNYFVASPNYTGNVSTTDPSVNLRYCQSTAPNCTDIPAGKTCPPPLTFKSASCDGKCTSDKFICIPK